MLIFLEILCMILFSACSSEIYQEDRCKLNGKLEYLDTVSLLELNLLENLDILLPPILNDDYVIPKISNLEVISTQEIGKQLNICPPVVFSTDITNTSCLINIEN